MRRIVYLLPALLLAAACDMAPEDAVAPAPPADPADLIQDANQNDGNKAFFWLAPIISNPSYSGTFNDRLEPKVVICEVDPNTSACADGVEPLATWTVDTGLTVSTTDEHYGFEWHTDQTATDFSATYRIQVFLTEFAGAERLGFADVQFFSDGKEMKNIDTGDYISLRDGRTLPGRFRIEKGVSCDAQTDCGEAMIGSDGGLVTTEAGFAGADFPSGALSEDVLVTIRRIDPSTQPWGRCLPTGLRQEEGCYEFETEPKLESFNSGVTVGVCIDPNAIRPDRLMLHKYDSDKPTEGVIELTAAPENFLTCGSFAHGEPQGVWGRLAGAAGSLLSPVARLISGSPLYASDTGRGGVTDAFSYIGWAEPVQLSASAPVAVVPGSSVPATVAAQTEHNHGDPALDASGHVLRFEYDDPAGTQPPLLPDTTQADGTASPAWTLTSEVGLHTLTVSTRMEITTPNGPFVVPDPTGVITVGVGGFTTANACDNLSDCGQGVVGPDGDTLTTNTEYAGVGIPAGALDGYVLVTIKRINPSSQDWGTCLPTGLRQEEGCYSYDTEPSLATVNNNSTTEDPEGTFKQDVVVAVCIDPDATRPDNLMLHKYDPEIPANGVEELPNTSENFLDCTNFTATQTIGSVEGGFFSRVASAAGRLARPLATLAFGDRLYATDTGRGGVTDAFSFVGWAEPADLTLASAPDLAVPGTTITPTVEAFAAHNHSGTPIDATDHALRFDYVDPAGTANVTAPVVTDATGDASPQIQLTTEVGTHSFTVSTRRAIDVGGVLTVIPDPTVPVTFDVGGYYAADDCTTSSDCVVQVVGTDGGLVVTPAAYAGVSVPAGAVDSEILVKVSRVDPSTQPGGECLPTQLRQAEGCYEFDTEPALDQVNTSDSFNSDVTVGVCLDESVTRSEYMTLHKYDPEYPAAGVVELTEASVTFLDCANFQSLAAAGSMTLFDRFAAATGRVLSPVVSAVWPQALYASDTGRGGVTDAFSFMGWAEPVTLQASASTTTAAPGDLVTVDVNAQTAHNHTGYPQTAASGHGLHVRWYKPGGTVETLAQTAGITDANGNVQLQWDLSGAADGTHALVIDTHEELNGSIIPDPTDSADVSLTVESTASISGQVMESTQGGSLPGGPVALRAGTLPLAFDTTDGKANYGFAAVDPGTVTVEAAYHGYETGSETLSVTSGQSYLVNFHLTASETLLLDQFYTEAHDTTQSNENSSLLQTFVPTASWLHAVKLRFRAGGSFTTDYTSTIYLRAGGPTGPVVATATADIAGPVATGATLEVLFIPDQPIPLNSGGLYAIEWLSPSPTIISWFSAPGDPYPAGSAYVAPDTVITDSDFVFWTYYQ